MSGNIIKKIYIYRDSHLPEKGWLQSCYRCYQITHHTANFKTIKKENTKYSHWEFHTFVCKTCQNHLYEKKNLPEYISFTKECNSYIKEHYFYLFSR